MYVNNNLLFQINFLYFLIIVIAFFNYVAIATLLFILVDKECIAFVNTL